MSQESKHRTARCTEYKSTIKTSSFIHQIINEMSRTSSARQYNHLPYRKTECTSLASYAAPQKTMHKIS